MEKLEKGNRKLKVVVFLVLCAVLAVFLVGATKWNKEVVTEKLKLVLKDLGFISLVFRVFFAFPHSFLNCFLEMQYKRS